ncbi:MAG TPA: tetratricopeptide repeat protein [Polyangiaceae bacterium]|nr:tetratricopeptide repeat protein [Polyangiaceae bacterium]
MSQIEPTDLLIRCRREQLTLDEQRRLSESIEVSLEVRLMSQILPELERESRVRPGDDVLLARINAGALAAIRSRASAPVRLPIKRRTVMLLVAAAVLLIAGLAGAWLGGALPRRAPEPASERARPKVVDNAKQVVKQRPPALVAAPEPAEPPGAVVSLDSIEPLPTASAPPRAAEAKLIGPGTASELFTRANLLRRQGRAGEAAVLYELLLDLYPSAREVGPTRLALAKFLQTKQPERALAQYRALASGGGALRAEALWGISEIATNLGDRSVAKQALGDLLREFPDSPYAEVARARALHDSH